MSFGQVLKIQLTGDANVDMLTVRTSYILSEIIHQYDFTNVIHEPTRVCRTRQSLLDPVLIGSSCTCPEASVISIHREISDHDATLAHINIPISISGIFKRQVWLYKKRY